MDPHDVPGLLEEAGQTHLLAAWAQLQPTERGDLAGDIASVDWPRLARLLGKTAAAPAGPDLAESELKPPASIVAGDATHRELLQQAGVLGQQRLRAAEVAALTVAGGQGTRLGFDGPKGMFPITPLRGKPLFQVFAAGVLSARRRYESRIPWYIMTSRENHEPTQAFFRKHAFFGLPADDVVFFTQGTMPAVDSAGRVLLRDRRHLALTPDGHGGTLRALQHSGALGRMRQEGIRCISYFQVDNPLVQVLDPTFIGLLDAAESEAISKAVRKAYDAEKVGVFVQVDGRLRVVEYSHMPPAVAEHRAADGRLTFDLANIAVHAFRLDLIERLATGDDAQQLPFHRAVKPVACIDPASGAAVDPPPAASKFEQFIFDCLPRVRQPLVYEIPRAEEFSPVKNAEGVDSPATAREAMIARATAWLRSAGVDVPAGRVVEISPLFASDAGQLRHKLAARALDLDGDVYLE